MRCQHRSGIEFACTVPREWGTVVMVSVVLCVGHQQSHTLMQASSASPLWAIAGHMSRVAPMNICAWPSLPRVWGGPAVPSGAAPGFLGLWVEPVRNYVAAGGCIGVCVSEGTRLASRPAGTHGCPMNSSHPPLTKGHLCVITPGCNQTRAPPPLLLSSRGQEARAALGTQEIKGARV